MRTRARCGGLDLPVEESPVGATRQQRVEPGLTGPPAGFRRDHAKPVVGAEPAGGDPCVQLTLSSALVVTQAPTWAPARLKVLVARDAGDETIGHVGRSGGRCVTIARRRDRNGFRPNEDQVALMHRRSQRPDFARRPDGAAGVVRRAEKHDLGARVSDLRSLSRSMP